MNIPEIALTLTGSEAKFLVETLIERIENVSDVVPTNEDDDECYMVEIRHCLGIIRKVLDL